MLQGVEVREEAGWAARLGKASCRKQAQRTPGRVSETQRWSAGVSVYPGHMAERGFSRNNLGCHPVPNVIFPLALSV